MTDNRNRNSGIQTWPHTPRFFLEKLMQQVRKGPTQEQAQAAKAERLRRASAPKKAEPEAKTDVA